jgi:N-sulfoglucosamine sulfohydrolase
MKSIDRKKLMKASTALLAMPIIGYANMTGTSSEPKSDQTRPNILWLTIEDSSPYQFSCYGNKDIKTSAIDDLAKRGVLFTNAYSTAPHCSPARSTLISGCFATSYGMDYHRKDVETPSDIFYPAYFKKSGYFCINHTKMDYNTTSFKMKNQWNECDLASTYASPARKPGQPFFAVFNFANTHMSRYRSITLEGRREHDLKNLGINQENIFLPPHVPDIPAMQSDQALMLERSLESNAWVRAFLKDLKAKKLDEDTIIFFFSDHGGCIPRGKGYPFDSGLRVPLVIYVPPKWQQQLRITPGTKDTRLIGFEDLAPTALSMAGIQPPEYMQGKAFYGKYENAGEKGDMQFGFRTNQEANHFDPCRTATDGRFKYIRNYIPHKPFSLRNFFQWGMPSNLAWDEYVLSGKCKNDTWLQTFKPKPSEMLFDIKNDPWELNNLADKKEYESNLLKFRKAVSDHIRNTKDLGFFVIGLREKDGGLYHWVRNTDFPLDELYKAVELASMPTLADNEKLITLLKSPYPELRYWGAVGFCTLGARGLISNCPEELLKAVNDPALEVATAAADAACYLGKSEIGLPKLIELLKANFSLAYSSLETMTWYPEQKESLKVYIPVLKKLAKTENDSKRSRNQVPIKARSLLINLGKLPVSELYTEKEKKAAIKRNLASPRFDFSLQKLDARVKEKWKKK